MKNIFPYILLILMTGCFISCSDDDDFGDSIFNPNPPERNEFDSWLLENYVDEYNIDFKYRLDDNEINMTYNLIPADEEKSAQLARIIIHLWLESYNELFDEMGSNKDFMREHAPKVIQLVGSSAINASSATEVLGTAEGGIKVVLYKVNSIDVRDVEMLNDYYFGTMHHEFAHILHQKKEYPSDFQNISSGDYSSTGWQNRTDEQAWAMGFVTPYASREPQEDFVEIIANYLIRSDEYWDNMLEKAGGDGAAKIMQKFEVVEEWLDLSWDIDIHQLKKIIAKRAENIETVLND